MMNKRKYRKPDLKRLAELYREDKDQLLTTRETAELAGKSPQDLANARWRGIGMTYDKFEGRCFYRPKYIVAHLRKTMQRIVPGGADA